MTRVVIYWSDLTEEKQEEILKITGGDKQNLDVFPIAILNLEEKTD